MLRYQSGEVLRSPASNNNLLTQLGRGPANNPATWGGGTTLYNRVSGQPILLKDPNCHCIDPTKDLVSNANAWADAPPGQFGVSAPYYNDYRWQRQPAESMSFGRSFFVNRERGVKLYVRAERITMGLHADLDEAAKLATPEMIDFLVAEKGMRRDDAYILCSIAVDLRVTQLVDGTKGIYAMLAKSVFK